MKYFSYLNSAVDITGLYKGLQPFHLFIKDFFKQHKKYGSTDRKQITHLCYCYFRLGSSMKNLDAHEKILAALFLCTSRHNDLLAHIKPEWNEKVSLSIEEKCAFLQTTCEALDIFPCPDELSAGINKKDFILSHLTQPDVFLRIRPGCRQTVLHKLAQANLNFELPGEDCIALPNATKIDALVDINKEVVVQDYSSQRSGRLLEPVKTTSHAQPLKVWDCCAASGGKSIMAKDILGDIDLTVSDVRSSVLINLKKRFEAAGIRHYKTLVMDLSAPVIHLVPASFQLIIADVPCTGSGTWGRTPERLSFFDEKEIDTYNLLQQKIITAAIPFLKSGGFLLYITCSAFKKENEGMAGFIQQQLGAELLNMETLHGYGSRADTMFAALLKKP